MDKQFIEEIKSLLDPLYKLMREQIPFWESEVDAIITSKETDSNSIARCLDNLLTFTDHGMAKDVFMKLITYYESVDPEGACFYLKEYNREEEE